VEAVPTIGLAALVMKFTDLVHQVRAGELAKAVTQIAVWVFGALAVALFVQTDFAAGVEAGGVALAELNLWSQVVVGISAASIGSVVHDTLGR